MDDIYKNYGNKQRMKKKTICENHLECITYLLVKKQVICDACRMAQEWDILHFSKLNSKSCRINAKKFQDGNWSIRLYTAISLQLRSFSKITTIAHQKNSRSLQQWVKQEAKWSILQDYEVTHRHTQSDCYNPPPTLGLKSKQCR